MSLYSTLSSDLLCTKCSHSHVMESAQGHSLLLCDVMGGSVNQVRVVDFVVTKCSKFAAPDKITFYKDALMLKQVDKHCWHQVYVDHSEYWVRADTWERPGITPVWLHGLTPDSYEDVEVNEAGFVAPAKRRQGWLARVLGRHPGRQE